MFAHSAVNKKRDAWSISNKGSSTEIQIATNVTFATAGRFKKLFLGSTSETTALLF